MTLATLAMRRGTPADKPAVVELARLIDPEDYVISGYDYWMQEPEHAGLFVAELDGQIVGCHCIDWPAEADAYFFGMRIHPGQQGKGIGSAYCRAQIEHAIGLGARNIYLTSKVHNLPAHRTVEKNGFVNLGENLCYEDEPLTIEPRPGRARAARPEDLPLVHRFLQERKGKPLSGIISGRHDPWAIKSVTDSDWLLEDLVVVEGLDGLDGLMLCTIRSRRVLLRWLDGTPEAADDLLGYAAATGRSLLSLDLPKWAEPLLAPLGLDPAKAFRTFVFHYRV